MSAQPWHQLCTLRDDVRSGKLELAEFAADLNDVRTGGARPVYGDAGMFFDRTYPTFRMKELARDVMHRLAGQGGRPVLRLQVAYGGGKTHTLIALLHLAERGRQLGGHPTVGEFLNFAALPQAPLARVALLPCDKLDVKEGLEVYGPEGRTRRVRSLWGALAYQLAGDPGYARLKGHDEDLTVPAEPLLVDILRAPVRDGVGALILLDEAVWYYRQLVLQDPRMLGALKDFFQVLTQAVAKVDRAAMLASLIASKVEANDQTGIQCLSALDDVFQRIAEPVEPVAHEDVAEILRRRLFESTPGEAERRPAVDAMLAAMQRLPLREVQRDQAAYNRMLSSYPFHPDLIEVLYQKWTQLSRFHRTRGALRLLAYALRDSFGHDPSPLVGPVALLPWQSNRRETGGLSPALDELVEVCEEERKWLPILNGELEKAREIQAGLPSLKARDLEQAVVATFLHSQPAGQRAAPSELLALLAHPDVDAAALEEGLRKWRERSWFLVEHADVWQLGTTANLTHMHVQAMGWLSESEIRDELEKRIRAVPSLKSADPDVVIHPLPQSPRDIGDDLHLHYLILGPDYAIELGKSLPAAVEAFLNEKAGPRIYRNNILVLAPEASSVSGLREQVRHYLGWARLESPENSKLLTEKQRRMLPGKKNEATNNLPEAVVGAYRVLVALAEDGAIKAEALRTTRESMGTPFERIKAMLAEQERLVATTLDPDLILPGSYLELWASDQTSKRVTDLIAAFGQFPRLPRLLRPGSLYDTLKRGVQEGMLVLRLVRADGSARTWWRLPPDTDSLLRSDLEVLPAAKAELHDVDPDLLKPGALTDLWPSAGGPLSMQRLTAYFDGQQAPRLASSAVLAEAVRDAVLRGVLMAHAGATTLYRERVPDGELVFDLLAPPESLGAGDLLPQALPAAWQDRQTTLRTISSHLAAQRGYPIPWPLLSRAVDEAMNLNLVELVATSGPWPCSPAAIDQVRMRIPERIDLSVETIVQAIKYTGSSAPTLQSIKEAVEQHFFGGRVVALDQFMQQAQIALQSKALERVEGDRGGDLLHARVRQPARVLYAEANFDVLALQKLGEQIGGLYGIAPGLVYTYRVSLTAEGQMPDDDTLERLNAVLRAINKGWALG